MPVVSKAAHGAAPTPRPGDFVIVRLPPRRGVSSYLIYRVRRRFRAPSRDYDGALHQMRRLAATHAVDGWYTSDDQFFALVAAHRSI